MADELLAKDPVGLNEDGIKVAKNRVLESARGIFETTLTHNKYAWNYILFPTKQYLLDILTDVGVSI